MTETLTIEFDGGSRGNPGPAGIGVVVRAADGTPLVTLGRFIGHATNNVAEYQALIIALQKAGELGAKRILVRGDSELIIKQLRGEYRVRHPDLRPLYEEALELLRRFESHKLEHGLRHKNAMADRLANLAMDRRGEVTDLEPGGGDGETAAAYEPGARLACPRCNCLIEVRRAATRTSRPRPFTCQCGAKMGPVETRE
jgi:ribonuclease HI